MRELRIRRLRTGISWADYFRPEGRQWYDWQMSALSEFDILLSVWHTPPSISEGNSCASPPRRLQDYADFIDRMIHEYGHLFTDLELWNEPSNRLKWNFVGYDPMWKKFGDMIEARCIRRRNASTGIRSSIWIPHGKPSKGFTWMSTNITWAWSRIPREETGLELSQTLFAGRTDRVEQVVFRFARWRARPWIGRYLQPAWRSPPLPSFLIRRIRNRRRTAGRTGVAGRIRPVRRFGHGVGRCGCFT